MLDRSAHDWGVSERAAALHADSLVWDNHGGFAFSEADALDELARWRGAGIDFLSVNLCYDVVPPETAIEAASKYRRYIRAHSDTLVQVGTVKHVRRARAERKLAVSFDVEGMDALRGDIGMVDVFYRLGVRQMLFAYNRNNAAGGGCHDQEIGLTDFGRAVIAEMNRVGMLVDCSHCSYRTSMEAMDASRVPVIFSHSNAREVWDHPRNIRDDQIRACAATGGVIGVTGVGRFLGPEGPTIAHLVEHIDHMVGLVGPEHVGFGMDSVLARRSGPIPVASNRAYWPEQWYPDGSLGYIPPEKAPRLTQALLDRGYDESAVRGILGNNFMRVAAQVWKPVADT